MEAEEAIPLPLHELTSHRSVTNPVGAKRALIISNARTFKY
jgi:hypothetical protein